MSELPFLIFPRPTVTVKHGLTGRGRSYRKPTAAQQRSRLQTRFTQIAQSFQTLQTTVAGIDPEQVIVLETLTESVEQVARSTSQIPGLEWLGERDLEEAIAEFGFEEEDEPTAAVPKRLYALMSNQSGMGQLLALWNAWTADPTQRAKRYFGPFKKLFELLADIRRWGPKDRIEATGILRKWQDNVDVGAAISFEIEFWFRSDRARRQQAYAEVQTLITGLGGVCLDQSVIEEILYHAALVELPAQVVQQFVQQVQTETYSQILRSEGVMFFRPRAQSAIGLKPFETVNLDFTERLQNNPVENGDPIIAVFDGVPVEHHAALAGRLVVDDPDGHAARYQPGQQQHGTAIASLVVHGDLNGVDQPLRNKVYLRPIFHPDSFNIREITPPDRLLVDLIHRAVKRLYEGDGQQLAVAPSIRIINLSLGNPEQPFDTEISPLARLIDWLSWKYKILVIISIGNRTITVNVGANGLDGMADEEAVSRVLQAMRREQIQKRPLSPAEAINCISVGGLHSDKCSSYEAGDRVDLLRGRKLPSPISTISGGFRRSTKPEILFPGGRLLYRQDPPNGTVSTYSAVQSLRAPGIMTATPGQAPMELNRVRHSCGSSNAAALASRCAALAHERLALITPPADCEPLNDAYITVLLKTLLVHGATWGEASELIERAFPEAMEHWVKITRIKQQFLGYGEVDIARCLGANEQRATLIGWGSIGHGAGHVFELPLPRSLSARVELRRLTVTLAWLTPTNLQHRGYRKAQLWIDVREEEIGTHRDGLDAKSAQRGTVEHRTFEGSEATPYVEGAKLRVQINCREDAGKLDVSVPYAVAVSLEVGPGVQIDVYQEISARLRQPVEIQATG